jgi:hypothetical protein
MVERRFQFQLTEPALVKLSQANCFRVYLRSFLVVVGLLGALELFNVLALDYSPSFFVVYLAMVLAAWYAFALLIWQPRRVRGIYREQASMSETRTVILSEEEILIEMTSGNWRSSWNNLVKWRESSGFLMLFINRASSIPISCEAAGDENVRFIKEHLIASGLPKSGKRRKKPK